MSNSYIVAGYFIYLPIALVLTWVVAKTLFKSGLIFMRDIFFGREEMATATNSLFKTGFYLLNVGETHYPYALPGEDRRALPEHLPYARAAADSAAGHGRARSAQHARCR